MPLPEKNQHPFSRQFITGHVLADEGELEGALDSFRDVPRSAHEWEASLFNQAILLARLSYLSDAEAIFHDLADRGIATNELIDALACAKNKSPRTPACLHVPLRFREDALEVHKEMLSQKAEEEREARVVSQAKHMRYDQGRLRQGLENSDESPPLGDNIRYFFKRLFMSKLKSKINAAANAIGYEKHGWIEFLKRDGRIIGIWVKAFPINTTKKHFLQMYCVSKNDTAYMAIVSGAYKISKSETREGFDVTFD